MYLSNNAKELYTMNILYSSTSELELNNKIHLTKEGHFMYKHSIGLIYFKFSRSNLLMDVFNIKKEYFFVYSACPKSGYFELQ